jgi:hypothetical protein
MGKNNVWGDIYFFNDEEVRKIETIQNHIVDVKEKINKQLELLDEYVLSYIHHKVI